MDSDDIFAAMGISEFGKSTHKRELDPHRFDKAKRDTVRVQCSHCSNYADRSKQKDDSAGPSAGPSTPGVAQSRAESRASPDGSEADVGPQPSANQNQVEPEYDPSEDEGDIEDDFPITHELVMRDHTKVVTALGMDPSGARVVSGSHDYDCKLWDFGGMTPECKPFKSWEPSGSYPVGTIPRSLKHVCQMLSFHCRSMKPNSRQTAQSSSLCQQHSSPGFMTETGKKCKLCSLR